MVGAAPTTTGRASTARWCGSGKRDGQVYVCRNQWLNPLEWNVGSNFGGYGRSAVHTQVSHGTRFPRRRIAIAFKLVERHRNASVVNARHLVSLVSVEAQFESGELVERPDDPGVDQRAA